jgi:hypothetical protein
MSRKAAHAAIDLYLQAEVGWLCDKLLSDLRR